jgi:hypothetical protein
LAIKKTTKKHTKKPSKKPPKNPTSKRSFLKMNNLPEKSKYFFKNKYIIFKKSNISEHTIPKHFSTKKKILTGIEPLCTGKLMQ